MFLRFLVDAVVKLFARNATTTVYFDALILFIIFLVIGTKYLWIVEAIFLLSLGDFVCVREIILLSVTVSDINYII